MLRLLALGIIHATFEARPVLAGQFRPACITTWTTMPHIAMGLEFAYLPFLFNGTPLALFSRLRCDGVIIIEIAFDDGRQPDRIIAAPMHHRALAQVRAKSGRSEPLPHAAALLTGGR